MLIKKSEEFGEDFNKFCKIHIFQHCFLCIFFADVCRLIYSLKTFSGHAVMLVDIFIGT